MPFWLIVKIVPPMLIAPVRLAPEFGRTVKDTIALPLPGLPLVTDTKLELLTAEKSQLTGAVTLMLKLPPVVGTVIEFDATLKEQTVWFCKALAIFNLPPVFTTPFHCGRTSTRFIKVAFREAAERLGLKEESRAAAPAACGDAIEVPLRFVYELFDEL